MSALRRERVYSAIKSFGSIGVWPRISRVSVFHLHVMSSEGQIDGPLSRCSRGMSDDKDSRCIRSRSDSRCWFNHSIGVGLDFYALTSKVQRQGAESHA